MADTATTRNRLRKPESGQYVNAWAPELNEDFGSDRLDQALDGVVAFTLSGSKTLTSTNYETDEARMRQIHITGGTGGTVTIPAVEKFYVVRNSASGTVVFTCGGTTASIPASSVSIVLCNGTNCYTMSTSADASAAAASAAAALASQIAAATSATNAATSETNSAASAVAAAASAAAAAASAASAWTQIGAVTTTSGGSASFTSIPSSYQDLLVVFEGVSHNDGSAQAIRIETSHDSSTWTTAANITNGTVANSVTVYGAISLPGYRKASGMMIASLGDLTADNTLSSSAVQVGRHWRHSAGIQGLRFSPGASSFDAGTIRLFGK